MNIFRQLSLGLRRATAEVAAGGVSGRSVNLTPSRRPGTPSSDLWEVALVGGQHGGILRRAPLTNVTYRQDGEGVVIDADDLTFHGVVGFVSGYRVYLGGCSIGIRELRPARFVRRYHGEDLIMAWHAVTGVVRIEDREGEPMYDDQAGIVRVETLAMIVGAIGAFYVVIHVAQWVARTLNDAATAVG